MITLTVSGRLLDAAGDSLALDYGVGGWVRRGSSFTVEVDRAIALEVRDYLESLAAVNEQGFGTDRRFRGGMRADALAARRAIALVDRELARERAGQSAELGKVLVP